MINSVNPVSIDDILKVRSAIVRLRPISRLRQNHVFGTHLIVMNVVFNKIIVNVNLVYFSKFNY